MSLTKRIISAFLVLVMLFSVLYAGNQVKEQEKQEVFDNTKTLHIWYTDEVLTDYLSSMAVKYNEENGVRVIPTLQSGLELLQKINEASLTSDNYPDLYIASNDNMEKAYLAGLAMEISDEEGVVSLTNFPESAMHAVTYQQKILGSRRDIPGRSYAAIAASYDKRKYHFRNPICTCWLCIILVSKFSRQLFYLSREFRLFPFCKSVPNNIAHQCTGEHSDFGNSPP